MDMDMDTGIDTDTDIDMGMDMDMDMDTDTVMDIDTDTDMDMELVFGFSCCALFCVHASVVFRIGPRYARFESMKKKECGQSIVLDVTHDI